MRRAAAVIARRGFASGPQARGAAALASASSATGASTASRRNQGSYRGAAAGLAAAAATTALCAAQLVAPQPAQQMSTTVAGAGTGAKRVPATADLCDDHEATLQVADPAVAFKGFGQHRSFGGEIRTVKCFENNPLVRSTLSEPGAGRVLVVDGGGSLRRALFGDNIAALAVQNGWAGVIIYGAIRDSEQINSMPLGVKVLGTNPIKSSKKHPGDRDVPVQFAGVTFTPGHFVYADADGIVVSATPLH